MATGHKDLSIEQLTHHQCAVRAPSCMMLKADMPGLELTSEDWCCGVPCLCPYLLKSFNDINTPSSCFHLWARAAAS